MTARGTVPAHEACDPDRREQRAHEQRLKRDDRPPRLRARRAAAGDRARDVELRPAVARLPGDPRRPQDEGDRRAPPTRTGCAAAAAGRKSRRRREPTREECRQRLVQQAYAEQAPATSHSRSSPDARAHEPGHRRPREQVERRRAEPVPRDEHDRRDCPACRSQHLCPPDAAELAREQAGEQHDGRRGERDGSRSTVSDPARARSSPARKRCQRTLVGVGPVEPPAGREEVELVAVVAVADGERGQDDRYQGGDGDTTLLMPHTLTHVAGWARPRGSALSCASSTRASATAHRRGCGGSSAATSL